VDGAIHRAGGPAILAKCRLLGGCKTGEAKATTAGNLPAQHVIHTVGPVWRGGGNGEKEELQACHRNALTVAAGLGCRTVAFPAISTGVYGYPLELAAPAALRSTAAALAECLEIELVTFVLFDAGAFEAFDAARDELPA
jgi:O-acetyl-ADP-ribose deacetylase (regulator of RNase III)